MEELDEVLIKVAEVGLDSQEDSTKLPPEQPSPSPLVFEELARSCSELSTPIEPVKRHLSKLAAGLSCLGIQLRILLTRTVNASVKNVSTRKLVKMGI